jgi:hypothetical protein
MISRISILLCSSIMLSMQINPYRTQLTAHFQIQYEKAIIANEIKEIGMMLEDKYSHFKNVFNISSVNRINVIVLNAVSRFKTESQSSIFDDGDFRSGKIYIVSPSGQNGQEKLRDAVTRVVAVACLEQISGCPQWLRDAYSLYVGNDLMKFGDPARFNIATFTDLGEDYNRASSIKDTKELYAKLALTIHFLVNRYGESKVELMLKNFKNGGSMEEVFSLTFNEKMADVEKIWVKVLQNSVKK